MNNDLSLESEITNQRNQLTIQLFIDAEIGKLNESSDRIYEPYILASERFQAAIAKARIELGIPRVNNVHEGEILEWVVSHLGGNPHERPTSDSNRQQLRDFYRIVNSTLIEAGLPDKWMFYVASYVVNSTPPDSHAFGNFHPVTVVKTEDDGIVIKIKKGARYEEFISAWKPIAEYLGKGRRKSKSRPEQARDLEVFMKRNNLKLTVSELAKLYFGVANEWTIDAVKKVLRRQKHLYEKGTDLTK